jgi:hypothetical protein
LDNKIWLILTNRNVWNIEEKQKQWVVWNLHIDWGMFSSPFNFKDGIWRIFTCSILVIYTQTQFPIDIKLFKKWNFHWWGSKYNSVFVINLSREWMLWSITSLTGRDVLHSQKVFINDTSS